ncbi:hypothetical protein [Caulobacter sp. S45]|uniref:hypothetical protein n=1 Tax=Caulobacter sp. S45 TaxID=1641861 RepID=UPI001575764E|nr:hypothetical protein [Caulobacter sp. S45]
MTIPATPRQAALDTLLELVTSRLEAALDLTATAAREEGLAELARLCADLQVLTAAAILVRER